MKVSGRPGWLLFLVAAILGCFTQGLAAQSVTAKLPLAFEPNRGQAPENARFVLREGALEGEFQKNGVRLRLLSGKKNNSQVSMRLLGAREDAAILGDGVLEGHTNYLLGSDPAHWLRGLPNYSKVRYTKIYSGTDLVFYGNGGALEHDFELQPEADPSRIAFQLDDARSVTLEHNGNLRIDLADGAITFERWRARGILWTPRLRWTATERSASGWAATTGRKSWSLTLCSLFPLTFPHWLRMRA